MAQRLIDSGVAQPPVRMGSVYVLPHHPLLLASWYDDCCAQTNGLEVWLHTELIHAEVQDRHVIQISCLCRGTPRTITARSFVDASGDAILATATHQPWSMAPSSVLQRPAYIAALHGAPHGLLKKDGAIVLAGQIALAVRAGHLPRECLGAHFRSSPHEGEVFITVDLPGDQGTAPYDPRSAESLTRLEQKGRQVVHALLKNLPLLAPCHVSSWPARAGIRESRRWQGRHDLTEPEILHGTSFDDGIASVTWPLEIREKTTGPRFIYPSTPQPADIPLRSLRPLALDNAFTAGRCISASHRAQASIRVMGTALATGQAAGIAAAEFARNGHDDSLATAVRKALNETPSVG
jgi:hypothetical protein